MSQFQFRSLTSTSATKSFFPPFSTKSSGSQNAQPLLVQQEKHTTPQTPDKTLTGNKNAPENDCSRSIGSTQNSAQQNSESHTNSSGRDNNTVIRESCPTNGPRSTGKETTEQRRTASTNASQEQFLHHHEVGEISKQPNDTTQSEQELSTVTMRVDTNRPRYQSQLRTQEFASPGVLPSSLNLLTRDRIDKQGSCHTQVSQIEASKDTCIAKVHSVRSVLNKISTSAEHPNNSTASGIQKQLTSNPVAKDGEGNTMTDGSAIQMEKSKFVPEPHTFQHTSVSQGNVSSFPSCGPNKWQTSISEGREYHKAVGSKAPPELGSKGVGATETTPVSVEGSTHESQHQRHIASCSTENGLNGGDTQQRVICTPLQSAELQGLHVSNEPVAYRNSNTGSANSQIPSNNNKDYRGDIRTTQDKQGDGDTQGRSGIDHRSDIVAPHGQPMEAITQGRGTNGNEINRQQKIGEVCPLQGQRKSDNIPPVNQTYSNNQELHNTNHYNNCSARPPHSNNTNGISTQVQGNNQSSRSSDGNQVPLHDENLDPGFNQDKTGGKQLVTSTIPASRAIIPSLSNTSNTSSSPNPTWVDGHPIDSLAHAFMEQSRNQTSLEHELREETWMHNKTKEHLASVQGQLNKSQDNVQQAYETSGQLHTKVTDLSNQVLDLKAALEKETAAKDVIAKQLDHVHQQNNALKSDFAQRLRELNQHLRQSSKHYAMFMAQLQQKITPSFPGQCSDHEDSDAGNPQSDCLALKQQVAMLSKQLAEVNTTIALHKSVELGNQMNTE